uniref:Uncharacterized protein n=1 Tax=Arundo donax TaxID=35708 RepID=A0A0A8XZM1_ARUDO
MGQARTPMRRDEPCVVSCPHGCLSWGWLHCKLLE